ncbi:MAG: alcohol dehydrogenase, zinc containing [Bacteroidetes bacterium]|nr:alcohol dehydrogenase, zinc containing [Bacteroidota bacterium]
MKTKMKAIVCEKYGDPEVLKLKEVKKPIPKDDEVLIRVYSVFVGIEDIMQRKGKPYFFRLFFGLTKPQKPIFGTEFSGEIEDVGKNVKLFQKGDKVLGVTGASFGCNAEYICMPETGLLSIKPSSLTYEESAPICGPLAAWNYLIHIAKIQDGQKVLIYGASGNIGLASIQIAKLYGAEVTGVCSSYNFDLVKSLGADHLMNFTRENFKGKNQIYDVILEVSGKPSSIQFKSMLKEKGYYITSYPTFSNLFLTFWSSRFNNRKVIFSATGLKPVSERLVFLKEIIRLFKEEKLKTIIDKRFQLEQMAEVHRYVEKGLEKGHVIVNN